MPTDDEHGIRNKNQVSSSKNNKKDDPSPLKRRVALGKKTNALRSKTKGGSNIAGDKRDSEMEDSDNEEGKEQNTLIQDENMGVHKKKLKKNIESKDAWT